MLAAAPFLAAALTFMDAGRLLCDQRLGESSARSGALTCCAFAKRMSGANNRVVLLPGAAREQPRFRLQEDHRQGALRYPPMRARAAMPDPDNVRGGTSLHANIHVLAPVRVHRGGRLA
eukprot:329684-Rhodomonas_salina.1